jgi:hypothetical protein
MERWSTPSLAVALAVAFVGFPAFAEEEAESEQLIQEVFDTELVYPQEQGEVQLTTAPSWSTGHGERYQLPLVVEYGLTDAWQVEAEWIAYQNFEARGESSTAGIGDVELGTKYSFMNLGETGAHAALGFELAIPTGDPDRELSEGMMEYEPSLMLAYDLPKAGGSQVFSQFGLGFVDRVKHGREEAGEDEEAAAHELSLKGGFFIPIGALRVTTEVSWTNNQWNNGGEEDLLYLTPGVVIDLPGTFEIGTASQWGLTRDAENTRYIAMLTYEFGGDDD